ncbi:hypothetical protein TRFO_15838 [Tritrichomonas foetus]|uniref:Uncharacterized protein n=1 Tax=Tritrichomonas foetus TaxID=1144522 RepID=A0A1J4KSS4_9EUKA|nr:hypothetical protein TRFO_15838 [Tritrichomonas foetus]|eukprot:OHT13936.1 hypothetical protein TRFO_15838 [Tritrichomonas foetus]
MDQKVKKAYDRVQFDDIEELAKLVPSEVHPDASSFSPTSHLHSLLQVAAAHGAEKCAEYLLSCGANPSKKNFTGFTPLHWAAYSGRTEIVKMLIDRGAKIDSRNEDGHTPLHIAASRGHLQFIKYIVELGADPGAVTSDGWTAMHFAVISNHQPVVKYLLAQNIDFRGPDVNMKTIDSLVEEYGRTWFDSLVNTE